MAGKSKWNPSIIADKLLDGELGVSVYGLGYIGLGVLAVLARAQVKRIYGVDIDEEKLRKLSRGEIRHPDKLVVEWIKKGLEEERITLTSNGVDASRETDIKIVDVPLGLTSSREPDYTSIDVALESIGKGLKHGDLVIVETTLPPLALREHVKPLLEDVSGLKVGDDFYLAYSPERVMIERIVYDIEEAYPKLVGGLDEDSIEYARAFYQVFIRKGVITEDALVVELAKIFEAIYRDVNIALANELAWITRKLGASYERVKKLASTNPYIHLHNPGSGVGGACLPVYPYFLLDKAEKNNVELRLVATARRVNSLQPKRIIELVEEASNKLGLPKPRILVLGVAYRGGIWDTRNSPSLEIIRLLEEKGLEVKVSDPYYKGTVLDIRVVGDYESVIRGVDIIIIATCHPQYRSLSTRRLLDNSGKDKIVVIDSCNIIRLEPTRGKVLYTSIGSPWTSI